MLLSKLPYAFRSLYRHKRYTLLNLGGLAIGLAVSLLVALYLHAEFTYDKHWPDHDRIYRVNSQFELANSLETYGGSGYALAPLMDSYFSEIEASTHLFHIDNSVYFHSDSLREYVDKVAIADSNFTKVFALNFIEGSPDQALSRERSIILSRSFAQKFFGTDKVLGREIATSNYQYQITGVFEDVPENSHHHFQALISEPDLIRDSSDFALSLWRVAYYSFVKLKPGVSPDFIEAKFEGFFDRYMAGVATAVQGKYQGRLQAIDQLHFRTNPAYDRPGGRLTYVYGFAGIGLLILVLVIINYVNMATARSLRRMQEAAMRKVLGAAASEIRLMIWVESILLALGGLLLAFALVEFSTEVLPFNQAIGKNLNLDLSGKPFILWGSILLAFILGIIGGLYPAINLAKVAPLEAFSNRKGLQRQDYLPRKILVGFQVTVSVAVVITAFYMYRQMQYIKDRNLGFNADQVILVSLQDTSSVQKVDQLSASFERSAFVESVTTGLSVTGSGTFRSVFELEQEGKASFARENIDYLSVGPNYLATMEIPLLQGRGFRSEDVGDTLRELLIVNQALVDQMQWQDPLGKQIRFGIDEEGQVQVKAQVIGVCSNFNAESLHSKVGPLILMLNRSNARVLHLKIASEQVYAALDDIERRWTSLIPAVPFQFSFLRRDLLEMYEEELRQSRLILYLTIVAIITSILGFVGLASFTTGLRTREIAIRSVLGAERWDLVHLIFKELVVVTVVGVLIAIPLSIWITYQWLQNFAYRTQIEPLIIVFTVIATLAIGYLIVAIHSMSITQRESIKNLA